MVRRLESGPWSIRPTCPGVPCVRGPSCGCSSWNSLSCSGAALAEKHTPCRRFPRPIIQPGLASRILVVGDVQAFLAKCSSATWHGRSLHGDLDRRDGRPYGRVATRPLPEGDTAHHGWVDWRLRRGGWAAETRPGPPGVTRRGSSRRTGWRSTTSVGTSSTPGVLPRAGRELESFNRRRPKPVILTGRLGPGSFDARGIEPHRVALTAVT
jgi:hypothetical protein